MPSILYYNYNITGALTKKMMLNKELLQGELPSDTSSTVSVFLSHKQLMNVYLCCVVGTA